MFWAATPAAADHIRGIRVTNLALSPLTRVVTINATGYTDGPGTPAGTTGLGISTRGHTIAGINWGDGFTTQNPTPYLVFVDNGGPLGTARYRGTYTHTYPDLTARTIRLAFGQNVGYTYSPNNTIVAGNPIFATDNVHYVVGVTNTARVDFGNDDPAPVPEPASLTLLGFGLAATGAGLLRRRRSSR